VFTANVTSEVPNAEQLYWNGREATHWRSHELSEPLLHRARERICDAGITNVLFECADAQVHPFIRSSSDIAISRFGVMFFTDPVAAFANVARSLRPGGRIAFAVWASPLDNAWITVRGAALAGMADLTSIGDFAAPGPFSLSDPDRVRDVLGDAGLVEVEVQSSSETLLMGTDPVDTVCFLMSTGFGRRLLAEAAPETIGRATDALLAALEPHLEADGVRFGSRAWPVTARLPGREGLPDAV
jgi:SAM-dependent methyltransferase